MASLNEQLATLVDNYTACDAIIRQPSPPRTLRRHGFPPGKHWVDYTGDYAAEDPSNAGSIVVIEQPSEQHCAVTGGIMAARMKVLGIKATVVSGRVRDVRELQATGLPVSFEKEKRQDLFRGLTYES
ncbi:hypothetical protein N7470_004518 [Penicillium chermesinum]|nr:hypothetical protein N7470_004518 [Penicillium chermesinum]